MRFPIPFRVDLVTHKLSIFHLEFVSQEGVIVIRVRMNRGIVVSWDFRNE